MDSLTEIQQLGETLSEAKEELKDLETEAAEKKEFIRQLEEVTIPQIMDERGIEEVRLSNGSTIKVGDFIQTRITAANEAAAFDWLRSTHNDGIIKNEIKVSLDRGDDDRVTEAMQALAAMNIDCQHKQTVHPSTLKAFITEALQNPDLAETLPKDVFSVYEARRVKFKS